MRVLSVVSFIFISSVVFADPITFEKQVDLNEYMTKAISQLPNNQTLLNKLSDGLSNNDKSHLQKILSKWSYSSKQLSIETQFGTLAVYNSGQRILTLSVGELNPLEIRINNTASIKVDPKDIKGSLDAYFKSTESAQLKPSPLWLLVAEVQAYADDSVGRFSGLENLIFLYSVGGVDVVKKTSGSIISAYQDNSFIKNGSDKIKNEYFWQRWMREWSNRDRWKVTCSGADKDKPDEASGVLNISGKKFQFDVKGNSLKLTGPKGVAKIGLQSASLSSSSKEEIDRDDSTCEKLASQLDAKATAQRSELVIFMNNINRSRSDLSSYSIDPKTDQWQSKRVLSGQERFIYAQEKIVQLRGSIRRGDRQAISKANLELAEKELREAYNCILGGGDLKCRTYTKEEVVPEKTVIDAQKKMDDDKEKLASALAALTNTPANNTADIKKCLDHKGYGFFGNTNGCIAASSLDLLRSCAKVSKENVPLALRNNSDFLQAQGVKIPAYKLTYEDCDLSGVKCKASDVQNFGSQNFGYQSKVADSQKLLKKDLSDLKIKLANIEAATAYTQKKFETLSGVNLGLHKENGEWKLNDVPVSSKATSEQLAAYKTQMSSFLTSQEIQRNTISQTEKKYEAALKAVEKNEDQNYLSILSHLESDTFEAYSLARGLVGCCGNNDCRASMKAYQMDPSGKKKGGVSVDRDVK